MGMPIKQNTHTGFKSQNSSGNLQNEIKTEENLQQEFKELLKDISTEVMDSTVNQSIREASVTIKKQVPEIERVVSKLRTVSDGIQKVKNELQNLKLELKRVLNGFEVNNDQSKIDEQTKIVENRLDNAISYLETKNKNSIKQLSSLVVKNNERIDKLEHIILLKMIQQEETVQLKIESTVKKWSIFTLIGVFIIIAIF